MRYAIIKQGASRSFPDGNPFLAGGGKAAEAEVLFYLGVPHHDDPGKAAILVELGGECLGAHTGERMGDEGSNVLGFARYQNGSDAPSNLVEFVRQPATADSAVAAARAVFRAAGLQVAVCSDQAGRIIDRLVPPKYNAALRFLDEGLASQTDMDLPCRLGLGYPDGSIERVVRGGLAAHHAISKALFEAYGTSGHAPARRSAVAARRAESRR
jgi:3-hydroxybutyryl-CoA dehydrogenase